MKIRGVQDSTLHQHSEGLNDLRRSHTNMDTNQNFAPEFAKPEAATVARPVNMPVILLPCSVGVLVGRSVGISIKTQANLHVNCRESTNLVNVMNEHYDDGDDDDDIGPDDARTAYL